MRFTRADKEKPKIRPRGILKGTFGLKKSGRQINEKLRKSSDILKLLNSVLKSIPFFHKSLKKKIKRWDRSLGYQIQLKNLLHVVRCIKLPRTAGDRGLAYITPLFKKGNYRSISLIAPTRKVYEKVVKQNYKGTLNANLEQSKKADHV